jgi:hypothetical protein
MVIANYMWQRERNRKEEAHEKRMQRFERLMETLKKPNSDKNLSSTIPPQGTEENPKSS